jgi:hypothetical protein
MSAINDVRHIRVQQASTRIGRRLLIVLVCMAIAAVGGVYAGIQIGAKALALQAQAEKREADKCKQKDALAFMELETRSVICWSGSNRLKKLGK